MNPMAEFPRRLGHISGTPLGRPRAVDATLIAEGRQLLAQGLGVRDMCERLGVGVTSWYRAVRPAVASSPRTRRNKQALPKAVVRRLKALRRQGLTLKAIAERLGLHINTLHKYCAQLGLIERRPCGCPLKGRPNAGCTHEGIP